MSQRHIRITQYDRRHYKLQPIDGNGRNLDPYDMAYVCGSVRKAERVARRWLRTIRKHDADKASWPAPWNVS